MLEVAFMPRTKRKAAEVEQVRERILEAAARAFSSVGYEAATMVAIAKEAGYTAPTLYSYFEGKPDIFEGLIALTLKEHRALFQKRMPAGLSFEQKLELLLQRQFELIDRRRDVVAFLLSLQWPPNSTPQYRGKSARAAMAEVVLHSPAKWFAKQTTNTEFSGLDPDLLASLLSGITSALVDRWLRRDSDEPAASLAPLVKTTFLGALRALVEPKDA